MKKNIKKRAGQATIEYLLLIVLIIALATGVGRPLGNFLTKFSGALLGPEGYYGCLTEEGLLPGDSRAFECKRSADLATEALDQISDGEGFDTGSGGGFSGGAGNDGADSEIDSDSSSKTGSSSRKNRKRHKASSRPSSNTGKSPASFSEAESESLSENRSESPASFSALSSKKKNKKKNTSSSYKRNSEDESLDESSGSDTGYKKNKRRFPAQEGQGYLGYIPMDSEKEEQKATFKVSQESKNTSSSAEEVKKNQLLSTRGPSNEAEPDAKIKKLDFSKFLKYFFIIALVVLVFIVIFSQIMEYQSRD